MYKAIALDLDGTLTDSKKELSQVNKEAISKAIDKGISVILASGRPDFGVIPIAKKLGLYEKGGYIIACNGGRVIDCGNNMLMRQVGFPGEYISIINSLARKNSVYVATYYGDKIVSESDTDEYVIKEAICNYTDIVKVQDLAEFVDYTVPKLLVVGPHERLLPIQKEIKEKYYEKIDAFFSEDYFLEVVPLGIEKGDALKILLKDLSIDTKDLIACGDGMNDIPMLKVAGLSVVMENGYEEVKKYADYIAASNDDNGVAKVIEKYILLD